MDVTTKNFKEILAEFDEVIAAANFFSIDSEFTGMLSERIQPYTTLPEYYQKVRTTTEEYVIVQFGITAFRLKDDDPNTFTYKSYNFYVYPRNRDQTFRCLGSSLHFLSQHKFDFNKLFGEGVPCCTSYEAKKLRETYDERQKARIETLDSGAGGSSNADDEIQVPLEEVQTVDDVRIAIKKFLKKKESDKKALHIGPHNAFQRKLIYQMIEKEFQQDITATSQNVSSQKVMVIERKWSAERQKQDVVEKNAAEENDLEQLIGLTVLLQKISQSKKPIVGHNMFLDLFYLIRQFFEPLALTLKSFKPQARKIFPNIFDTKHICNQKFRTEFTNSTLKYLLDSFTQANLLPKIEPESPEYGYKQDKEHEAGYDSYITGAVFLGFARKLNINNADISSKSSQLRPYLNKIYVLGLTDIFHIDLYGNEPAPNRTHVFYVSFPESFKQGNLIAHFRKYGPVNIRWINATSAFVALANHENSSVVLRTANHNKKVKVHSFENYLRITGADYEGDDDEAMEMARAKKRASEEIAIQRPEKKPKKETKNAENQTEFVKQNPWPEETF